MDPLVLVSTREKNENVLQKVVIAVKIKALFALLKILFVLHKKDLSDGQRLKVFKFPKFFTFNTCNKP